MSAGNVTYIITFAFRFVLIPLILLGILIWALVLTGAFVEEKSTYSSTSTLKLNTEAESRRRWYGFLLGFAVGLLIVVISLLNGSRLMISFDPTQPLRLPGASVAVDIGAGLLLGVGAMAISRLLMDTVAVAILVALLSGSSFVALFNYVFASGTRDTLLVGSLSFIIGTFAYRVIDARSVGP